MPPLSLVICIFFPLFMLVGCHGNRGSHEGTLIIANGAEPASLDVHAITGKPELRIAGALFEGLVTRDFRGNHVTPGVAKNWEISPDGRFYTFHLRTCTWSNGRPLTSKDFVRSWERFIDPATASEYSGLMNVVHNAPAIHEKRLPVDSLGVAAPNDSTFTVKLDAPVGYFLDLCAFEPFSPVPVDTIIKYREQWTSPAHIVGNGPFVLSRWRRNIDIQLVRNANYWGAAEVKQEKIEFKPVEDQLTAYNMFLSGEVDWLFSIPPSRLNVVKQKPEFFSQPMFGTYYYIVNCKNPGYNLKELRLALSYAIDRQRIVEKIQKGIPLAATGFVPPLPGYPRSEAPLFDPALAKAHLLASGFGPDPGKAPPKLQILFNTAETHRDIAEVVRQMWKENLGLESDLDHCEWKVYLERTKNLNYPAVARASWIGDFPDPISFLELYTSGNGNNRTGYSNAAYDSAVDSARSEVDPVLRMKKLFACEKMLMEEMPIIPIYYYSIMELRNPKLRNASPNPLGDYSLRDVYLEL